MIENKEFETRNWLQCQQIRSQIRRQVNNISALVQIMAWHRPGDKPLSELMMVSLLTHTCGTRLQLVNDGLCVPVLGYIVIVFLIYFHLFDTLCENIKLESWKYDHTVCYDDDIFGLDAKVNVKNRHFENMDKMYLWLLSLGVVKNKTTKLLMYFDWNRMLIKIQNIWMFYACPQPCIVYIYIYIKRKYQHIVLISIYWSWQHCVNCYVLMSFCFTHLSPDSDGGDLRGCVIKQLNLSSIPIEYYHMFSSNNVPWHKKASCITGPVGESAGRQ